MARLMSSTELHQRMTEENDVVVIDVLTPEHFKAEHIPGSRNIPLEKLEEVAKKELNKNQRIVVYGSDHDEATSNKAAELLERIGFRKVSDFDGGIFAWKRAGFLTEGDRAVNP